MAAPSDTQRQAKGTVLIVEDDPSLAAVIVDVLLDEGYAASLLSIASPDSFRAAVGRHARHPAATMGANQPGAECAVEFGLLEIASGALFSIVAGQARPTTTTTYQLWPLLAPSKLNATLDFATNQELAFAFQSSTTEELLAVAGIATTHVDRPLSATGARFPYAGGALVIQTRRGTGDALFVLAARPAPPIRLCRSP